MSEHGPRDLKKHQNPPLSPPDTGLNPETARKQPLAPVLILLCFIMLLAGAGSVLFLLPGKKQKDRPPPANIKQETVTLPAEQAIVAPADSGNKEATTLLETLLALQVRAEAENISGWGGTRYQTLLDTAAQAEDYFSKQNYPEAVATYGIAIADLNDLLDSRQTILKTSMEKGWQALADDNSQEAAALFKRALAIDPVNSEAKKGAQRAASLDTVIALFNEAITEEQSGRLQAAEAAFANLLTIDEAFLPGRDGLSRVRKKIVEQRFQAEMSSFLEAVSAGQLGQASTSLAVLKSIKSSDEQVIKAEKVLADKKETAHLASLRKRAENQSDAERWSDALATFTEILKIAPEALFAVNGRPLAAKRLDLDMALQDAIKRPHRLQDDTQREAATQLLAYAEQIEPKGPRLSSQVSTLRELITRAGTPVTITLESDNNTDIIIYHIGRLGRFLSRQIVLKPGTYTIVGTRLGYRDSRRTIEVTPGSDTNSFSVVCREPI